MVSLLLIDLRTVASLIAPFGDCGTAGEWGEAMIASTEAHKELEGD
jgi:hypothetical protein